MDASICSSFDFESDCEIFDLETTISWQQSDSKSSCCKLTHPSKTPSPILCTGCRNFQLFQCRTILKCLRGDLRDRIRNHILQGFAAGECGSHMRFLRERRTCFSDLQGESVVADLLHAVWQEISRKLVHQ